MSTLPDYAELMALSHFSFQHAASSPEELVDRAAALGYQALAVTDECSVAGVVRAHAQARQHPGLQLLPGAVFTLPPPEGGAADGLFPGWRMVVLPRHLMGWGQLCRYITLARAAAPKGQYRADWPRPGSGTLSGCDVVLLPPRRPMDRLDAPENRAACAFLKSAGAIFDAENGSLWLGAVLHQQLDDDLWLMHLSHWSQASGLPLVALGGAVMHHRSRKPLHDVLTAIRLHRPVAQCGQALLPNAQAHLRTRLQLARVYPPELLAATLTLAGRCRFSLDELRYRYPRETVAPGETPSQTLARLVWAGAAWRYGCASPLPPEVHAQLTHELALIAELGYEMYFLTVHDLVRFARSRDILCQGRGSAANSAVCYCLGITEVDPARATLLFERFISRERDEPPDIDVDFEHQRREEVIQYIYAKYGRDRAALAATVISYRPRSALRDVGRALGVDERLIHAFCKEHPGMYGRTLYAERLPDVLARLGMDAPDPHTLALWLSLAGQLLGVPRHLSQHVGGFVLTEGPLTRLVPIEPAAMDGRSIIQWDKDDLDAVGLMKVDVLALGMLTALRRALHLLTAKGLPAHTLAAIPPECPAVYAMVSRADTVGVFQIESRAQMSMLPRLRPEVFYDLVVQVAIVRPGPIQGGMVHPYLRRRRGLEPVVHLSPQLEQALGRTLGVPIFQEQVMQVVMLCAGFSAGEADQLRRAMAAWKRKGGVDRFRDRVVQGMVAQGYPQDFAEAIFAQIEGFGEYGFPESHAASFALLAYASAWLKCHHPDVFLAALLNSQPMGFYTPSQLVQDAQRHGVQVLPVDVRFSDWDCTLVAPAHFPGLRPVRLGLRLVKNFNENAALRLLQKREQLLKTEQRAWASVNELARLAGLNQSELDALAAADALRGLAGHRRTQVWAAAGAVPLAGLFRPVGADDDALPSSLLPEPTPAQDVVADHAATGLSLRAHPVSFLRPQLSALRLSTAAELAAYPSGRLARACGIVTVRQQPGTASGVVFVTLEDETGTVNVIVWPALKVRQRQELTRSRLMAVYGVWQRDDDTGGQVRHLVAKRLRDLTPLLGALQTQSRDFH
jgi:error-prone DNA polymerase